MGVLLGILAALVGLYIALWLTIAGLFYVVLPVMIIALLVAGAVGVGLGLIVPLLTLAGRQSWRPRTITPTDVVAGTAGMPKAKKETPFAPDPAWPSYLMAQARIDLYTASRRSVDILGTWWRGVNGLPKRAMQEWVWAPVLLFCYPALAVVSAGALVATGVTVTVGVVAFVVPATGWLAACGLLRGADRVIRLLRGGASGSCPHCYRVSDIPVFRCPNTGCGAAHRDIRPGRLGAVVRRCACGQLLPTTVLRATRVMKAVCPACDQPLRAGAGAQRDIRLPVFGPVSAGKTRLVYAGLLALRDRVSALGGALTFVDDTSERAFDNGTRIITDRTDTPKTASGQLPTAISAQLRLGKGSALVHLFDAAGEFYVDRDDNTELAFLDFAQGLVFVVDPFSIGWVQNQLGALGRVMLARANPATEAPEAIYHITVGRMRDYKVRTDRKSLAIAVVKADLLEQVPLTEAVRPDNVREWLRSAGLDNLVLAAERDFAEVRYFLVASVANPATEDPASALHPLDWLLSRAGLQVSPHEQNERQHTTGGV